MTPMWCSWMHLARLFARLVRRGRTLRQGQQRQNTFTYTLCSRIHLWRFFPPGGRTFPTRVDAEGKPVNTFLGQVLVCLWPKVFSPRFFSIAGGFQRASCNHLNIGGPYIRDRLGHCREICWGRHRCDVLADLLCAGTSSVLNMSLHRLPQSPTEKLKNNIRNKSVSASHHLFLACSTLAKH